ncbi:Hypothetical protein CINCED_3A016286 [Cinara cedri]|uniref:Uncharacterized protein n=1 Tax=Cinara cedri TaxID=506608 RepID=A0A5E4MJ99_9HEMI|nr:Hypothetical protein CINCED_3A016286 [Cinara cedri]
MGFQFLARYSSGASNATTDLCTSEDWYSECSLYLKSGLHTSHRKLEANSVLIGNDSEDTFFKTAMERDILQTGNMLKAAGVVDIEILKDRWKKANENSADNEFMNGKVEVIKLKEMMALDETEKPTI